jgi:hypothetical protein
MHQMRQGSAQFTQRQMHNKNNLRDNGNSYIAETYRNTQNESDLNYNNAPLEQHWPSQYYPSLNSEQYNNTPRNPTIPNRLPSLQNHPNHLSQTSGYPPRHPSYNNQTMNNSNSDNNHNRYKPRPDDSRQYSYPPDDRRSQDSYPNYNYQQPDNSMRNVPQGQDPRLANQQRQENYRPLPIRPPLNRGNGDQYGHQYDNHPEFARTSQHPMSNQNNYRPNDPTNQQEFINPSFARNDNKSQNIKSDFRPGNYQSHPDQNNYNFQNNNADQNNPNNYQYSNEMQHHDRNNPNTYQYSNEMQHHHLPDKGNKFKLPQIHHGHNYQMTGSFDHVNNGAGSRSSSSHRKRVRPKFSIHVHNLPFETKKNRQRAVTPSEPRRKSMSTSERYTSFRIPSEMKAYEPYTHKEYRGLISRDKSMTLPMGLGPADEEQRNKEVVYIDLTTVCKESKNGHLLKQSEI